MQEVLKNIDWVTLIGAVWEIALLPIAGYIISLIRSYTSAKKYGKYAEMFIQFTKLAVKDVYETHVKTIKGTDAWTKEAQITAKEIAKRKIENALSNAAYQTLKTANQDFEEWLDNAIEAAIYDLKREGKKNE